MVQPQHAKAFANGMEFFATYGGCTAAGAAGMATLKVIQEEKFQERAARVGRHLTAGLLRLKEARIWPQTLCLLPEDIKFLFLVDAEISNERTS